MNVNREIKSAGFDNLKELTTELKNNGKLIEELPYPLRFNPEVILASLTNYLQATEYIDNVFVSENFLTRVFVINIEAFIKIVKHPISEDLFKQIISNIAYIDNLKYDAKLQDKLYEVFAMLPTEYIIKYKSLLCKSDFFIYYSAKEYLSRFAKSKDDVVEKILAFESALKERNLSNMEKLSLLLANYIPKFGIEYYEVFAKYINLNYSVDDIITLYKKPYFIRTSSEFIFFYINTLTSFYDILIFLYGLFDYSSIIEYYFNFSYFMIIFIS